MLSLALKHRELRSSAFHLLSVPRVNNHAGTHAFSVTVSSLWNSLHEHDKSSNIIVSFSSTFENSPFQTRLSFLSFYSIWTFVIEFCIVLRLWVCPTSVVGMSLSSIPFEDIGAIEICNYYYCVEQVCVQLILLIIAHHVIIWAIQFIMFYYPVEAPLWSSGSVTTEHYHRVRISAWPYLKVVSSLPSFHYLWSGHKTSIIIIITTQ